MFVVVSCVTIVIVFIMRCVVQECGELGVNMWIGTGICGVFGGSRCNLIGVRMSMRLKHELCFLCFL